MGCGASRPARLMGRQALEEWEEKRFYRRLFRGEALCCIGVTAVLVLV